LSAKKIWYFTTPNSEDSVKYACSSNQVNIYACVKRYTPATTWFTFIFIFLYQILNIRYIPFTSLSSLLYLVCLKHARIVDACMCVAFTCLQTVWVILKYACSSNQVNIYACVSYSIRLQLHGSLLFLFFYIKY
jgi:hypothetical protein